MSADFGSPSAGENRGDPSGLAPGGEATGEDLVLGWITSGDEPDRRAGDSGCLSCGYAGELFEGPDASACPACLAEYPKTSGWQQIVRCPSCNLAIGVADEDAGKTLICLRCKFFIGSVPRAASRARREFDFGWVKLVPAWFWLLLAGWQVTHDLRTIVISPVITRILPFAEIAFFLILAFCRTWVWRRPAPNGG